MVYVNGYDDPRILAGQGTTALEVIGQMEQLGVAIDAVVIPVGGAGLLAGMSTTLKHFLQKVEVIVSTLVNLIMLTVTIGTCVSSYRVWRVNSVQVLRQP